ncbi:hypothetical protein HELRODRAFT_190986 [Helobdella robusta]|uniref:CCHC-type domain-containing protein n=1 Tax=Helobdella robusta TaxID=6412 RepID=T1FSH1_HELRO|nr:hypothetical protein HELRODRAFT_190986 [Helobdella robusta]ESO07584.1 hypothetical protein HELRODRAFT_190986 [Helobdella robusta]
MVQKDDMCAAFKSLRSVDRIEILCGMLQLCVPLELRFIGSCLEDLIQRNYRAFYECESAVNDPVKLSEILKIKNVISREYCGTLNMYLSLLRSDNQSCSLSLYSLLNNLKECVDLQCESSDSLSSNVTNELIEDVILLFTMASYHPAFSVSQRSRMYTLCKSLRETLKGAHNQNNLTKCQLIFNDNETSCKSHDSIVEVSVEQFNYDNNQPNHVSQLLIYIHRTNSTESKLWKTRNEFFTFHSDLLRSFPDVVFLHKYDSSFNSGEIIDESNAMKQYFKELSSLKDMLYSDVVFNFIQNSSKVQHEVSSAETIDVINQTGEDGKNQISRNDHEVEDDDEENQLTICPTSIDKQTSIICTSNLFNNVVTTDSVVTSGNESKSSSTPHSSTATSPIQSPHPPFTSGPEEVLFDNDNAFVNDVSDNNTPAYDNALHISASNFLPPITHDKSHQEMKCCEEVDSQLLMSKIAVPCPEGGITPNFVLNTPLYLCPLACGVGTGAGDQPLKHHFNCSKFEQSETSPFLKNHSCNGLQQTVSSIVTSETMAPAIANPVLSRIDAQYQFASAIKSHHSAMPLMSEQLLQTTFTTVTTTANVRGLRPILGASVNQLPDNAFTDDTKGSAPNSSKSDLKTSHTTVITSTLPRPSSCGCILQHDHDQSNNFSSPADMNFSFANVYTPYPTNYIFGAAVWNNGLDACLLPPPGTIPPYNQSIDHSHSSHNFSLNNIHPTSYIQTNSLSTASNSSSTTPSNSIFSPYSFNIWPHPQMYFRSNGFVNPRYPPPPAPNFRGNFYLPPPLDFAPYANPHNFPPPTIQSVPSNLPGVPSQPSENHPQSCCNCGTIGHTAESCTEPFMISVGQQAQFKLRTVPKSLASQS